MEFKLLIINFIEFLIIYLTKFVKLKLIYVIPFNFKNLIEFYFLFV